MIADIVYAQINLGILVEMSGSHDVSNGEVLGFVNEVAHGALIAIIDSPFGRMSFAIATTVCRLPPGLL